MQSEKFKVWLPAIRASSGADIFTQRLAASLERHGMTAQITWLPLSHELLPVMMRRIQPPAGTDLVIANSWSAFAFRRLDLPMVAIVHHCVFDQNLRHHKSILQFLYHRLFAEPREAKSLQSADAVVAVSHYVARHFRLKRDRDDAVVIYNWVDTGLFKPPPQEVRRGRPFRLLFVGKLSRLKGGDMLAPLMRRLGADFELRFTVETRDCQKMNLPDNMIPIGRLAEEGMIRAYQECDALLLPSRSEGFGYTALEAMACGKPVIASNNSALPEIVADGVTGILCDTGDVESFSNACQLLAGNPELCSAMGRAGRQRVVERFQEALSIEGYIQLIHKLLSLEVISK